jgi:hypothetical protein
MASKSDPWWARARVAVSAPLFYIGLAGVPGNIVRWWYGFQWVYSHAGFVQSHPLVGRVIALVAALVLASYSQIKDYFLPTISVDLIPTAGQRPEMELRVTNRGKGREFYAQCEFLALRHSPNRLSQVSYSLKWESSNSKRLFLAKGESAKLLIARAERDHKTAFAEMELLGLYGEELKRYESAGWHLSSRENVPEYDLKISIFSDGTKKPLERIYTLKPKTWYGPLEMIELATDGAV